MLPSFRFDLDSVAASAVPTCGPMPAGSRPCFKYARQASVVMVKPGGTGNPNRVISAKFAPFPPKRSAIVRSPSVKS